MIIKKCIKKVHIATTQNKDLNQKIQHKLYNIRKLLSNLDKHLKLRSVIPTSLIFTYLIQCIYHLSLNGINLWYLSEVVGLGILYISLAMFIKWRV